MEQSEAGMIFELFNSGLGFVAALITVAFAIRRFYKLRLSLKEDGLAADETLEEEFRILREIGGNSVSARTDLGFYVNLEVSKFNETIADLRHGMVLFLGLIIIILVLLVLGHVVSPPPSAENAPDYFSLVAFFSSVFFLLFLGHLLSKERKKLESYRNRVFEIWKIPVDKRLAKIPRESDLMTEK